MGLHISLGYARFGNSSRCTGAYGGAEERTCTFGNVLRSGGVAFQCSHRFARFCSFALNLQSCEVRAAAFECSPPPCNAFA